MLCRLPLRCAISSRYAPPISALGAVSRSLPRRQHKHVRKAWEDEAKAELAVTPITQSHSRGTTTRHLPLFFRPFFSEMAFVAGRRFAPRAPHSYELPFLPLGARSHTVGRAEECTRTSLNRFVSEIPERRLAPPKAVGGRRREGRNREDSQLASTQTGAPF